MSIEQEIQDVYGKSSIIVDNLSISKIEHLLLQKHEEERLDYKEGFDASNAHLFKKNKIDLVCDIISMANTFGGYILLGVCEKDNEFLANGVTQELIDYASPENINTLLRNYVDDPPRFKVASFEINSCQIIAICVFKSEVLIPFSTDGQYVVANEKKSQTKFYSGEVFVRHSAKSERANFADMMRFVEQVREEERRKLSLTTVGIIGLSSRLDLIANILGGKSPGSLDLDIGAASNIEIENFFYDLASSSHRERFFNRKVDGLFKLLDNQLSFVDEIQLREVRDLLQTISKRTISKFPPIWLALLDSNQILKAGKFIDKIYRIYSKAVNEKYEFTKSYFHKLQLLSEIIQSVLVMGAIAIKYNRTDFCTTLIERKGDLYIQEQKTAFWFRSVLTWLARNQQLDVPSLVHLTFESYKNDEYITDLFDDENEFVECLCQFDYFQCLMSILSGNEISNSYPSFKLYPRSYCEPIIIKYVFQAWTEEYKRRIADAIVDLDQYGNQSQAFYQWSEGGWHDKRIIEFLKEFSIPPSGPNIQ
jgi:hypothetical protein